MKITVHRVELVKLEDFADQYGLEMEVVERSPLCCSSDDMFYARFKHCEVKNGGILRSAHGNGEIPEEAIYGYARNIRGVLLVCDAYSTHGGRREIQVPDGLYYDLPHDVMLK